MKTGRELKKYSMKKVYIVIDKNHTEEDSWETHLSSLLLGYVDAANLQDVIIEEVSELSTIKTYFEIKYITSNDIFVFTNAWDSTISTIKHWSEIYKVPVKLIGFWHTGSFVKSSTEYRPNNDSLWRRKHEYVNMLCLDESLFIDDCYRDQFIDVITHGKYLQKLNICKFPLDYLSLEMSLIKDKYYKQNMVVFPWAEYDALQEQIMYDLIRVLKGSQVIFACEHSAMDRYQILDYIAKSKVVLLPYTNVNLGKEIYECYLLETIPLIPDIEGFEDLVPEEFRYPPEWTSSILNYSKFGTDFTAKIHNLLDNYDNIKPLILDYQTKLTEKYFDSEQIIKKIFE